MNDNQERSKKVQLAEEWSATTVVVKLSLDLARQARSG
eukprot:CAMPEP_0195011580 /NCGR_PEP_ID=MMETSP0326_2-20130528/11075_1 /TAXON_ID=2866 ORGANISM="Crypthecodinium cohnii, Strain Seligo" /NCGR_SAMPLE_ID=MMETSP0326_2 /ASSEMBLY_ACC=CAM_ASM_000348 /LENGTH=37 /DNA_ID= /DNA_START= /DNA_END= /DNA_ORIENTATION=